MQENTGAAYARLREKQKLFGNAKSPGEIIGCKRVERLLEQQKLLKDPSDVEFNNILDEVSIVGMKSKDVTSKSILNNSIIDPKRSGSQIHMALLGANKFMY